MTPKIEHISSSPSTIFNSSIQFNSIMDGQMATIICPNSFVLSVSHKLKCHQQEVPSKKRIYDPDQYTADRVECLTDSDMNDQNMISYESVSHPLFRISRLSIH
ncbi:hypothetical protein BLOT_003369 [Blomia tropicalis]|nr:hypothetical protein BLOT_003369 [Blomia tropicalis]